MPFPDGREARWGMDGTAALGAVVLRDGVLVGFVSPVLGSAAAGAAAIAWAIAKADYGAGEVPPGDMRRTAAPPRGRWYGPGTVDRRRNGLFPGWWRGCPGSAEVPHGQRDTALRADPSVGGRDAGHGPWRRLMAPRDSGESHRGVTPLELLVDLCFVVASKRKPTSPPWTRPCSAEPTSRPALARSRWGSTRRSGWRPRQPQAQDTRWL